MPLNCVALILNRPSHSLASLNPSLPKLLRIGKAVKARCVLCDRCDQRLLHGYICIEVQIIVIIQRGVVVRVADLTLHTSKLLKETWCLGLVSTGEEPSARNPVIREGLVVATTIESGGSDIVSTVFEPLAEECLDLCRAWWAFKTKATSIAVKGGEDVVWRGDHIKVHVELDLVHLRLRLVDALNVGGRAEETEFLAAPPAKADGVVGAEVGELDCCFEDTD